MNQESEITKEQLERWARSMAGCDHDNGDASAKVWICGIEPGGGDGKDIEKEIRCGWEKTGSFSWPDTFNEKQMKFLHRAAQAYAEYIEPGLDVNVLGNPERQSDNNIFKANLYPAATASDTQGKWLTQELDKKLKFSRKSEYKSWCKDVRFPFFTDMRKQHKPEIILCFGLGYFNEFLKFFGASEDDISSAKMYEIKTGNMKKRRKYFLCWLSDEEGNKSTLLVCMLFATRAAHSYLRHVGNEARETVKNKNYPDNNPCP